MPSHNLFAFDLISDLYLKEWPSVDWSNQPTSLIAVVAGDLSSDLDHTVYELKKISKHYCQVMYIDGDLEHQGQLLVIMNIVIIIWLDQLLRNNLLKIHI